MPRILNDGELAIGHQRGGKLLPPQRHQRVLPPGQHQGGQPHLAHGLLLIGSALRRARLAQEYALAQTQRHVLDQGHDLAVPRAVHHRRRRNLLRHRIHQPPGPRHHHAGFAFNGDLGRLGQGIGRHQDHPRHPVRRTADDVQRHIAAQAMTQKRKLRRQSGHQRLGHLFHRLPLGSNANLTRPIRPQPHHLRQEQPRIGHHTGDDHQRFVHHSPFAQPWIRATVSAVCPGDIAEPAMTCANGSSPGPIWRCSICTAPPQPAISASVCAESTT